MPQVESGDVRPVRGGLRASAVGRTWTEKRRGGGNAPPEKRRALGLRARPAWLCRSLQALDYGARQRLRLRLASVRIAAPTGQHRPQALPSPVALRVNVIERRGLGVVHALNPSDAPAPKAPRVSAPKSEAPCVGRDRERRERAALLSGARELLRGPKERGDCVGAYGV